MPKVKRTVKRTKTASKLTPKLVPTPDLTITQEPGKVSIGGSIKITTKVVEFDAFVGNEVSATVSLPVTEDSDLEHVTEQAKVFVCHQLSDQLERNARVIYRKLAAANK